ncbi:MAG: hypothetical protein HMLIMOIP_000133 [Candidatus Nitrosomirales archaeon]|jgi:hypothetical protein
MQEQLPAGELSIYTEKKAAGELKQVEDDTIRKARAYLEGKAYDEIITLLLSIDREIELISGESRKLRLEGRLDVSIFNILMKGYCDIKEKVFDLSNQYGLSKEVRSLYNFSMYASKTCNEPKDLGLFNESNTC